MERGWIYHRCFPRAECPGEQLTAQDTLKVRREHEPAACPRLLMALPPWQHTITHSHLLMALPPWQPTISPPLPPHGSPAMAAHHHPYLSAALASGPPFCQGREPSLAGQDICMASIFHTLIIF